ncbi:DUF1616 domain-containing protein [Methanolobus sp.]|uniref:DUF1616 domain-containing protein n=1 Tax=Methanolobus sp. TaxID=1874737 RepID=UPI0031837AB1
MALLTGFSIIVPPLIDSPIRMILAIPMVLFIPGYALVAALFPGKGDLDGIERIALSFGLSIAVVPLIGLLLNYTPWGIKLLPVLVSLTVFTLAMVLIAIHRRRALGGNAFTVPFRQMYTSFKHEMLTVQDTRFDRMLNVILASLILILVLTLAYVVITPTQGENFTEFYILGSEGMAEDYNTKLEAGESVDVIIGIVNHESTVTNYSLQVYLDDKPEDIPGTFQHISLNPNETWERPLSLVPDDTGNDMKLQYLLYKEDNMTDPYGDLRLWITVTEVEGAI